MNLMAFRLPDFSFPSNAICGLAPVAFILWFADRRVSVIVWTLVLIWGMGRIYVGIHYPIDIVGGIVIGCIAAILAMKLATALDRLITLTLNIGKRLYLA
jgi:undecaprenyl-diphosphatase